MYINDEIDSTVLPKHNKIYFRPSPTLFRVIQEF